uniref:WH2 domain-containing protein n=3 Tax=Wuchereria bancrofti TaxID=6293 RepID=A0AAF5PPV5_WUCBA
MPIPPPPPLPPAVLPSLSVRSGTTALQSKGDDRSKLLSEIQTGMKLRKTVTNDRSAPVVVGRRVSDLSETNGRTTTTSGSKVSAIGGVNSLFVNGIPKKPSDNKRNQTNVLRGLITSPPLLPKPSEMHSAKPITHSESQEQQLLTSLAECPEASSICRQASAGIAGRLKQFNQISRPGLAPPTPPSLKTKPIVKDIKSPPVKKISVPEQFKTLRPNRPANDVSSLRRSGSSDNVRNSQSSLSDNRSTPPSSTPLPLNPSSSTRISKPACPPPPPPVQASRVGRPMTNPFNYFTSVSSSGMPPNVSIDEDSPPPPPPPRIASCTDQMDRFIFIPVSELPPPGIFSGTKKIYEYHPTRKIQNAPSL